MLPLLLAQVGIPLLARVVGGALGRVDNPIAKAASDALGQVDAAIGQGTLDPAALKEANRHVERLAEAEARRDQTWLKEVNATIRAEVASDDPYVRRMRPTFGYVMALTWGAQMGAIAYVIVAEPESAGAVVAAMASLGTIWTVGLSVLGIYVYKRSQEEQGNADAGLLGRLARRLTGS